MDKIKINFLFAIFFLIGIVSAVPPVTQVQNFPEGYTIEYPNFEYLIAEKDFDAHIHVFNSSNGIYLDNNSIECFIHLYNTTGSHLIEEQMGFYPPYDFEYNIGGGNFTTGLYSIIYFCYNGGQGGYAQKTFQVTPYGEPIDNPSSIAYGILIFSSLIILIFSIIWFNSIPWEHYKNDEGQIIEVNNQRIKKTILFFVSYFSLLMLVFFTKVMVESFFITNNTTTVINAMFIMILAAGAPIAIATVVIAIATTVSNTKLQEAILRGI